MCAAPPIVGAWSMAVLLWQFVFFEYYYYYYYNTQSNSESCYMFMYMYITQHKSHVGQNELHQVVFSKKKGLTPGNWTDSRGEVIT